MAGINRPIKLFTTAKDMLMFSKLDIILSLLKNQPINITKNKLNIQKYF